MKVAFDTSVLVPALLESHQFHERSYWWLAAAESGKIEGVVAWHGVAETWSVLTRQPLDPPIGAASAERMIERVLAFVRPLPMAEAVYRTALRRCCDIGLRSGAIFDALHLAAAERAGADVFLTLDIADFTRLAASESPRIAAPPDPPGPLPRAKST